MARRNFQELAVVSEDAANILALQQGGELAEVMNGLRLGIENAAEANVAMVASEGTFTQTEIQAMTVVESLRQVNGLDFAAVILRAYYLRKIQEENALANHPSRWATLGQMAEDLKISTAELSQTLDLVNIIFPYVNEELSLTPQQLWDEVGKSKLREMTPVLKSVITGADSDTASTRAGVERCLEEARDILVNSAQYGELGFDRLEDESISVAERQELQERFDQTVRHHAVDNLITRGMTMTVREIRGETRPERTPNIEASILRNNDIRMVVAEMTEDQYLMFVRKMGAYLDEQSIELAEEPQLRQAQAASVPELRALMRLLGA